MIILSKTTVSTENWSGSCTLALTIPACKHRSLSPITTNGTLRNGKANWESNRRTGMGCQGDYGRRRKSNLLFVRSDELSGLHTAHERHRYVHLKETSKQRAMSNDTEYPHKNDIELFVQSHPLFEGINSQATILCNLNGMSVFLENPDS